MNLNFDVIYKMKTLYEFLDGNDNIELDKTSSQLKIMMFKIIQPNMNLLWLHLDESTNRRGT